METNCDPAEGLGNETNERRRERGASVGWCCLTRTIEGVLA